MVMVWSGKILAWVLTDMASNRICKVFLKFFQRYLLLLLGTLISVDKGKFIFVIMELTPWQSLWQIPVSPVDFVITDCAQVGWVMVNRVMQVSVKIFPTGLNPGFAQASVNNFFSGIFCTQGCRYVWNNLKNIKKSFHRVFMTKVFGLLLKARAG